MAKTDGKPINRKMLQRPVKPKLREEAILNVPMNRQEIERELAKLEGMYCPTANDKYQILLKRDNLLSKLRTKTTDVKEAKKLTATCPDMCPEKERYMRLVGNLLHAYECNSDGKLNHSLAVKDYSRSAADQDEPLPHELRSPDVLQKTMDYLILKIDRSMPRSELGKWYDFTWSRTRAIRKDITQQMVVDELTVSLVEKCTRFHIYASFRMAEFDAKNFDERMNTENLSKCLQTLRHMYDDLAKKSIFCTSEPEFRAYDILLNLADSNVLSVTHTYHKTVRSAPIFKFAVKLTCAYRSDNYVTFFRLIRQKATYLQACLCYTHFKQIRSKAMHTIVKVARPARVSVSKFTELLAFDDDIDTQAYMKSVKLYSDADGMIRYMDDGELCDNKTKYGCRIIEEKLHEPLSIIIAGGPCNPPVFQAPVDSFVSDYYLKVKKNATIDLSTNLIQRQIARMAGVDNPTKEPISSLVSAVPSSSANSMIFRPPIFSPSLKPKESTGMSSSVFAPRKSLFPDSNPGPSTAAPSLPPTTHISVPFTSISKPEDVVVELPSDFNQKARDRLADKILNFCVDDFIWLSIHELRRRENERQLETQRDMIRGRVEKLPELGREMKTQLFNNVIEFCVDDLIWLAAHEFRRKEQNVTTMREKHNSRIVRPYAQKWLSVMRFQMFLNRLPELNNSATKRYSNAPDDEDAPKAKRGRRFINPMKFSTNL